MPLQELTPGPITDRGRHLGRSHDIGEHHRGQAPIRRPRGARAEDERFDLGDDRRLVAGPREVVDARQLHVACPVDAFSDVASEARAEDGRIGVGDRERRDVDGRQDVPDVEVEQVRDHRASDAGARREALIARPSLAETRIARMLGAKLSSIIGLRHRRHRSRGTVGAKVPLELAITTTTTARRRSERPCDGICVALAAAVTLLSVVLSAQGLAAKSGHAAKGGGNKAEAHLCRAQQDQLDFKNRGDCTSLFNKNPRFLETCLALGGSADRARCSDRALPGIA